jgi:hypothetical protein
MSVLAQHIAALIIHMAQQRPNGRMSVFLADLPDELSSTYSIKVPTPLVDHALAIIADLGGSRKLVSPLTGDLYQLDGEAALHFFRPESAPTANTTVEHDRDWEENNRKYPILNTFYHGGQTWIERITPALQNKELLANEAGLEAVEAPSFAPASDRIVTLSHNQQVDLESASTDLIETVEKENSLDGDSGLRQRILGQIRAGRELIRAQVLSAYLLYQTLVAALGRLITRYKGHAIGIAAAKLLELLIEHIFKQS